MQHIDVAIIGAGPAGSAAGIALANRGWRVALFDRQSFPREKLCGDFVNPINLPLLRRLGVEEEIRAQPHATVTGFRITSSSGAAAEAQFWDRAEGLAAGLGLRRALFDHVLARRAAAAGATVRWNIRVRELSRSESGWTFRANEEAWQAKIVIGADGRNSSVAVQLGLNGTAAKGGRSIGFQARLKGPEAASGAVEIHLFPGGYAGLIGLGNGELNLCLALDRRAAPRTNIGAFLLEECLTQNPRLKERIENSMVASPFRSVYPVYFPRRRCYADRAVLVGDAARVSEPVTGEGIYFAMQSGLLAADVIDQALASSDCSAAFLQRYEQRCDRAFRGRLRLNAALRFAVYRPELLNPLIRLLARKRRWLDTLVGAVCAPQSSR